MTAVGRGDVRWLQIAVLATLALLQGAWLDFGTTPAQVGVTVAATLGTQWLACRWLDTPCDARSPLITALSLSLLLRSDSGACWAAAGVAAVGSKFLIRWRGKHLFNPACFGIVLLLLAGAPVWVSPSVWGAPLWFGCLLAGFATLVLSRAARWDTALAFLACTGALLVARCLYLGDPLTIPWHQMHAGALLLFACFMITDPRTTPDDRVGRLLFAAIVALLAYTLQFDWQLRAGLFYALALAAPLVPLLDHARPAARFRWHMTEV